MLRTLVRVKAPLTLVSCKEGVGRLLAPPSPDDGPLESPLQVWTSVLIMMITMLTHHHSAKCGYRSWIMVLTSQLPRPGNELSLVDPDTGEAEGDPTQTSSAPRVWPPVPVACFKTRGNSRGSENVVKVFSLYLSRHSKSFMCKR